LSSNSLNVRFIILAAVIAVVSAGAGYSLWKLSQLRQQPRFNTLLVLPETRVIADFDLLDQDSNSYALDDLRGGWRLIFFGFTNCPDVCPGTLFELQKINENMDRHRDELSSNPTVIFVSVDPERDTPAKMKQYLAFFNPEFLGVTGDAKQLLPLSRQLGIAYRIEEHEAGATSYGVDHSASILLTDPDGRLYGAFPAPHDAEKISADLLALLRKS